MKKLINSVLGKFGYQIINVERTLTALAEASLLTMPSMLQRLAKRPPVEIKTVIDVGASDGRWSRKLMPFYPHAKYLLIDANNYHENGLKAFITEYPNAQFVLAAAGDKRGEIYFDKNAPLGGVASHTPQAGFVPLPVTTIDDEIAERNLPAPYLIKLDTHGFEPSILKGATATLKQTNMLIIEAYNFTLIDGAWRFYELCAFMEQEGFHLVDFYEPGHRDDGVFWQIDLCFIRADRPEFAHNRFEI